LHQLQAPGDHGFQGINGDSEEKHPGKERNQRTKPVGAFVQQDAVDEYLCGSGQQQLGKNKQQAGNKNIEETLKKIEIKLNIEREKRNSDKEDYELKCIEEYSNENLNFKQTFDFMTFRKEKNTKDKEASKSTKSDTKNEIIDHKAFEFVSSEANRVQYYTNIRGVKTITSDIYKTKIPCPFNCVSHLRATVEGSRREMLKQCRKNPNSQWCVTSCKNNYKPTEEELCAYYEKFKK